MKLKNEDHLDIFYGNSNSVACICGTELAEWKTSLPPPKTNKEQEKRFVRLYLSEKNIKEKKTNYLPPVQSIFSANQCSNIFIFNVFFSRHGHNLNITSSAFTTPSNNATNTDKCLDNNNYNNNAGNSPVYYG